MIETTKDRMAEMAATNAQIDDAFARATRDDLLTHARLGRSVAESRDGQVVWITPAEIFARYGLDEFGRPLPQ